MMMMTRKPSSLIRREVITEHLCLTRCQCWQVACHHSVHAIAGLLAFHDAVGLGTLFRSLALPFAFGLCTDIAARLLSWLITFHLAAVSVEFLAPCGAQGLSAFGGADLIALRRTTFVGACRSAFACSTALRLLRTPTLPVRVAGELSILAGSGALLLLLDCPVQSFGVFF